MAGVIFSLEFPILSEGLLLNFANWSLKLVPGIKLPGTSRSLIGQIEKHSNNLNPGEVEVCSD